MESEEISQNPDTNESFISTTNTKLFTTKSCFNLRQLNKQNYQPFSLEFVAHSQNQQLVTSALSSYDLFHFQLTSMGIKPLLYLPKAHNKRINQIIEKNNLLYSCSNDNLIKIWDFRLGNKPINQLEYKNSSGIFSIDVSQRILAAGINENLLFWDLRKMKFLTKFEDIHLDDVTKVKFCSKNKNWILSVSVDGNVCLNDLNQKDNDDSLELLLQVEQPLINCGFHGDLSKTFIYLVSSVNSLFFLNSDEEEIGEEIVLSNYKNTSDNIILGLDWNQSIQDMCYYNVHKTNYSYFEKYQIKSKQSPILQVNCKHNATIRTILDFNEQILSTQTVISGAEDSLICINKLSNQRNITPLNQQKQKIQNIFEFEASQTFTQDIDQMSKQQLKLRKQKKKNSKRFKPF